MIFCRRGARLPRTSSTSRSAPGALGQGVTGCSPRPHARDDGLRAPPKAIGLLSRPYRHRRAVTRPLLERAMLVDTGSNLIGGLAGVDRMSLGRPSGVPWSCRSTSTAYWGIRSNFRGRGFMTRSRFSGHLDAVVRVKPCLTPPKLNTLRHRGVVSAPGKGSALPRSDDLLVSRASRSACEVCDPVINNRPRDMSAHHNGECSSPDGAEPTATSGPLRAPSRRPNTHGGPGPSSNCDGPASYPTR